MKSWRTYVGGCEFKVMRLQDAPIGETNVLDTPESVVKYLTAQLEKSVIYRPDVENLMVVHLNTRKRPIGFEVIGTGTLDTLWTSPREIFKSAIVMNAAGIVLAHNHPSGDPCPSQADIKLTRDIMRAGQLLKIELLDHVILVARPEQHKSWSSLRELGYLYQ